MKEGSCKFEVGVGDGAVWVGERYEGVPNAVGPFDSPYCGWEFACATPPYSPGAEAGGVMGADEIGYVGDYEVCRYGVVTTLVE